MIEVRDLVVRFGEFTAVDKRTLTVPSGCLYGLLGPNGAGKTTTISCIGGLRSPTSGCVSVGGIDVTTDPLAVKRRLGIVPQKLALYGERTVRENLQIFAGLHGLSGQKMRDRA